MDTKLDGTSIADTKMQGVFSHLFYLAAGGIFLTHHQPIKLNALQQTLNYIKPY
jgi:hypothetical protein